MRFKLRRLYIKIEIKREILNSLVKAVGDLDRAIFQQNSGKITYRAEVFRSNNFSGKTVYRQNNIKIEIRANEGNHKRPHFHVSVKEQSASIALDNLLDKVDVLSGKLDAKYMKEVVRWARENYTMLIETWKQFHGYVVRIS